MFTQCLGNERIYVLLWWWWWSPIPDCTLTQTSALTLLLALWRFAQTINLAYQSGNPTLLSKKKESFHNYFSHSNKDHFIFQRSSFPLVAQHIAPKVCLLTRLSWTSISLTSALPLQSWCRQMCKGLSPMCLRSWMSFQTNAQYPKAHLL